MTQHRAKQAVLCPDDAELVRRALARDAGAFRAIMQRHNRHLYRIARSVLRNSAEAEDAVQEAYVSAFTHLAGYRGESALAAWLARITMNEAFGRLRRKRPTVDIAALKETRSEAEIIQFPLSTQNDDPERTMAQRQILQLVEQATDNLPEAYRLVFVTRVIEGMSVEETSELLGIKPETVKTRLHRARQTRARSIEQTDRSGPDGCVSFCRPALRANDRSRHETARRSLAEWRNLSPRKPSNSCHVHQRPAPLPRPAAGEHYHEFQCARAGADTEPASMVAGPIERRSKLPCEPSSDGAATIRIASGLIETPARVTRALEESFVGYTQDPAAILQKSFDEIEGYDEMIVLRGIRFESHCEHHMAPILGRAWVGYVPNGRVVGISKLARVVETYAKRLQIQEKLTAQIANTINDVLKPQGVGVVIKASHHCMTTRGVHKPDTDLVTSRMLGCFRDNPQIRQEFLGMTA